MQQVIWGPWTPCTAILVVLIKSFRVSYVIGIWFKAPKTKIEGLFRFSDCPLVFFFFSFAWYSFPIYSQPTFVIFKIFLLVSSGGKEQEKKSKEKTNSLFVQEWDIPRKKRNPPLGS